MSLTDVVGDVQAATRAESQDISGLRTLHRRLLDGLESIDNDWQFLIGLTYKGLIEDVLQNCMETDAVEYRAVQECLYALSWSWEEASAANDERITDWFQRIESFVHLYRRLPSLRSQSPSHVIEGMKFALASEIIPPFGNDNPDDPTLKLFPDIDDTLSDPKTSGAISQWYEMTIHDLAQKYGGEISICFIDRPYSAVGGLLLHSHLVNSMKLPAIIYRRGFWDTKARIRGNIPSKAAKIIIVYDIAIEGREILGVAKHLAKELEVVTIGAVVMYDFDQKAQEILRESGIELVAFKSRRDIRESLDLGTRQQIEQEVVTIKEQKTSPQELVMNAIRDPQWRYRTVEGISRETSLEESTVEDILERSGGEVRASLVMDDQGRPIFARRSQPVTWRERLSAIRIFLAKSST